ncbi:MAG: hypothetical protein ACT6S0_23415 [Roseateles sp.]|uniref:hypothetical protein n=1 Tax=Roseateles sp. TaxID=1971397 RepID=UPI0040356926
MPALRIKTPSPVVANARHSPPWLRFAPSSRALWRASRVRLKNSHPPSDEEVVLLVAVYAKAAVSNMSRADIKKVV